jgi:hypothetical protein
MRITGRQLRQIIKEEVARMMNEDETNIEVNAASDQTSAAKIKDTLEKNAFLRIRLSDRIVPFRVPRGTGKLIIKVTGPDTKLAYDLLDEQGAKLPLGGMDGHMLFPELMYRMRTKMLPAKVPPGTFEVVLPITWTERDLTVGTPGGPVLNFGGGTDYEAYRGATGGITIQGVGFR